MKGSLNLVYLLAVILDLSSPFWAITIWRYLRQRTFAVWQSWVIMASIWLAATYAFAQFAGYTVGNYLLVSIAGLSLILTGELPGDTQGLTYNHYVTDQQMMFRYWTVPPVIFVILPTVIIFSVSRLWHERTDRL